MLTTVDKMIDKLQELSDDGYGDVHVRIATQPNWPLAFYVDNVKYIEREDFDEEYDEGDKGYVWIATSEGCAYESPYAPREAWEEW